jgi:methylmalonyl-CoA mutase cobalamin-binding subunit
MNRIYVSGPMTGLPDLNFPAFHRAAATLRESGYEVVNPAEIDEAEPAPRAARTWADCLRRDIQALVDCTAIALLPGWEHSRGAKLEKHIATELGMRVIYVGEFTEREQKALEQS